MRNLLAPIFLIACLLAAGNPSPAQQMSKQAKVERILELTNSEANVKQTLNQMKTLVDSQMKSQLPNATAEQLARVQELQSKMMDLVESRVSWAKMRPELAKIYNDLYSEDEISGMLAFYESPAGRGYLEKMPTLTQRVMTVTQTQMSDLMPEIQRLIMESVRKQP